MTENGTPGGTDTSDHDGRESTTEKSENEETILPDEITDQSHSPDTEALSDAEKLFDEMDVGDVDGEALWDELAGAEAAAAEFDAGEVETADSATVTTDESISQESSLSEVEETIENEFRVVDQDEEDETDEDRDYVESLIDKRIYCQQCPHFTEPPAVSCNHDGTSIVEIREDGKFVVRDCPVVTETGPDRSQLNKDN